MYYVCRVTHLVPRAEILVMEVVEIQPRRLPLPRGCCTYSIYVPRAGGSIYSSSVSNKNRIFDCVKRDA